MDKIMSKGLEVLQDKLGGDDNNNNNNDNSKQHSSSSGNSGHGGRQQELGGSYNDHTGSSGRDMPGYPRESASSHGQDYTSEGQGYSSHGRRSGYARPEDSLDSSSREYRPAQGSGFQGSDYDEREAKEIAEREHGGSGGGLFEKALGMLSGKEKDLEKEDVDEEKFVRDHKKMYGEGGSEQADSKSIGAAAAMQALKMFTGGGSSASSGGEKKQQGSGAFVGMAMAEAAKLFDKQGSQGNVAPGAEKQDAVSQAAQMALKLFLKSKMDSGSGGGSSGMMSLASKFLTR